MKYYLVIIFTIIALLLLYQSDYEKAEPTLQKDTIIDLRYDTINILQKGEIRFIKDTIIITKPFISKIDTNHKDNIFEISYSYPENNFDVRLETKDSLKTITKEYSQKNEKNIWLLIISFLLGIIIGLL